MLVELQYDGGECLYVRVCVRACQYSFNKWNESLREAQSSLLKHDSFMCYVEDVHSQKHYVVELLLQCSFFLYIIDR